ncbi:MAG: ShlB/FhaC/HecB family hemolysin secretion/activation protein [Chthoniobacter sp.]|nr:ShlB/FhaC/HecB family hemolysin secretion/activation protein [Chthoniobacter sp.]
MVPACYAKQHLVIPASAILLCWAGFAVSYAEAPKDYTAPPEENAAAVTAAVASIPTPGATSQPPAGAATSTSRPFFIQEYRILGSKILTPAEIGDTVYPFLGPGRTVDDVEHARAALEKVYHDKGYQTVSVQIPQQQGRGGVVFLEVTETKVGRLRVKGSRYYSLDTIRKGAPSLAPGNVPNFNDLTREMIGLNQWPDRRVTVSSESIRPGVEPGTVDIDLMVKDTFPLHGSVELNNRYSPDTSELRLNGGISYGNLWQLGHAAGVSFQISPENREDVKVISGYYLARLPHVDWLTLTLQATKQDSNVSTLGGAAVAGKGETVGLRASFTLPQLTNYVHSLTLGIDYKHYEQNVLLGLDVTSAPTSYYPLSIAYSGTWLGRGDKNALGYSTDLNAGLYFHLRGMGSSETSFDNSRFGASGDFLYFRGDLTHEHDLPGGFQVMAKVQGQIADEPLLSAEQFSAGGLSSVRGYLEGEVPGDNAIIGSIELRSPSLISWLGKNAGEWRVYAFFDGGYVTINDPLPEQESHWELASVGAGSRIRLSDHFNGSIDAGLPLISQTNTVAHDWLFTFRVWADF